jgi:hypothetical protein
MPAHPSMFDGPEMDVLDAWCRQYGLDTAALFKTDAMPEMWRDGERAWWVVRPPAGGEVIIVVHTADTVRH